MPEYLTNEQLEAEWLQIRNRRSISKGVFTEMKLIEDELSHIYNVMYADLNAFVLGKSLPPEVKMVSIDFEFEYPASPWQMFKEKHKDSWWMRAFVRRYPVQSNTVKKNKRATVSWDKKAIFPDQELVKWKEKLGDPVVILSEPFVKWE